MEKINPCTSYLLYELRDRMLIKMILRSSGLKAATEGFIMAAQDQSLWTRNFQANVIRNGTSPNCRLCDKFNKTIDHLISGCPTLAKTEYVNRHNRVGTYIHWKICKYYNHSRL